MGWESKQTSCTRSFFPKRKRSTAEVYLCLWRVSIYLAECGLPFVCRVIARQEKLSLTREVANRTVLDGYSCDIGKLNVLLENTSYETTCTEGNHGFHGTTRPLQDEQPCLFLSRRFEQGPSRRLTFCPTLSHVRPVGPATHSSIQYIDEFRECGFRYVPSRYYPVLVCPVSSKYILTGVLMPHK